VADEEGAAALVKVGFAERERLLDVQPGSPKTTMSPCSRRPCAPSPAARITAMISSAFGGSAG